MAKVSKQISERKPEDKSARRDAINGKENFKAAILRTWEERSELLVAAQPFLTNGERMTVQEGRRGTRVSIQFTPLAIPDPTSGQNSSE